MRAFSRVRALAAGQHGVVTAEQLRRLGYTRRQIQGAVERGEFRPLHRGVYLLGQFTLPFTAEAAAVLACGDGAVVSHGSAAWLYGMLDRPARPVHVTVARRKIRGAPEIAAHEAALRPFEIRERQGLPVTAPIRTLVDLAATGAQSDVERALAEAFALRLTTPVTAKSDRGVSGPQRRSAARGPNPRRRTAPHPLDP